LLKVLTIKFILRHHYFKNLLGYW